MLKLCILLYNLEITAICCNFNMTEFTLFLTKKSFSPESWFHKIWDIQKVWSVHNGGDRRGGSVAVAVNVSDR